MDSQQEFDLDTEIDPQLFLKCRLCIVENGSYQIHQVVQQQIEYCFGITVKHLDRLSQLICRKCKGILNKYYETKVRFLENQVLLQRLNEPKIIEEEATQADTEHENKENCIDEQLNQLTILDSDLSESSAKIAKDDISGNKDTWKLCFDKKFMCRFCKLHFSTRERIRRHYKTHSKLLRSCDKEIKKHCQIRLDRWDNRLNLTGGSEAVVISSDRIIVDEGKINYYVSYQPKCDENDSDETKRKEKHRPSSKRIVYDSTSDEEDFVTKPRKKRKKLRLSSRSSSNETVVIDGNKSTTEAVEDEADIINYATQTVAESQKLTSDENCINIDDSSNEAFDTTEKESKQTDQTQRNIKEIQTITSMCYTKYINVGNNETQIEKSKKDAHLEESLNRKLLSIGRKVMTTQGISSPGLLKYLQHKNLTVNWFPNIKAPNSYHKEANKNYIRIMTKLEVPANPLSGWTPVTVNEDLSESCEADEGPRKADVRNVIGEVHIPANKMFSGFGKQYTVTLHPLPAQEPDSTTKNKLLNANPVANPKTLPKKTIGQESKPEPLKQLSKAPNTSESICIESDDDETNSADLSMPIIMCTTSLAVLPPKENDITTTTPGNNNTTEKSYPRIKCKPVSELMAPNKLNGQDNAKPVTVKPALQPIHNTLQSPISTLPNLVPIQPTPTPTPKPHFETPNIGNDSEQITMNSIDLPNTSTTLPIDYFRRLLQMHNLILISEPNYPVEKSFASLVKFKLDISRQDKSVIVGLSLYVSNNIFCIKLRKITGEEMSMDTLPTFWQMHILKSFEGEVSEKILNCATKVSHAVHLHAKKFVCLLKSIEYTRHNVSS